jgi:hypothetical protein
MKGSYHTYKSCIDACLNCAALCHHCASGDVKEGKDMARCAQLCMECAAICEASAALMSLGSQNAKDICKLCAEFCERCAAECCKHQHEHCKECCDACKKCADACRNM